MRKNSIQPFICGKQMAASDSMNGFLKSDALVRDALVRVVGMNGGMLGVMTAREALNLARQLDQDLFTIPDTGGEIVWVMLRHESLFFDRPMTRPALEDWLDDTRAGRPRSDLPH